MPAQWLYMLEDGSLVPPTGSGATVTVNGASPTNPIVARIAFWTDDETCKINLNTAAGDEWNLVPSAGNGFINGSFWDVPRATTLQEVKLALNQPARREFQRYPGHPGTTYLSAAFPGLTRDDLATIVPRMGPGGSEGGTRSVGTASPITLDNDRLYATEDELLYRPGRTANPGITPDELERARFFITTNSRAPEENLFNKPRVAIWPISQQDNPQHRTTFDRLIAFCATLETATGEKPYYFQRGDADSPTSDLTAIARNQQLLTYLKSLTASAIPGFGGNFVAKYGPDRNQILTEIIDYIRSTNLFDELLAVENNPNFKPGDSITGGGQFTDGRGAVNELQPGHGQVAPLRNGGDDTQGFGRFVTLSEIGLHFVCVGTGEQPTTAGGSSPEGKRFLSNTPIAEGLGAGTPYNRFLSRKLAANERLIEAILLPELFNPAVGYTQYAPAFTLEIVGADQLELDGKSLGFPAIAQASYDKELRGFAHARAWGGSLGVNYPLMDRALPARVTDAGGQAIQADQNWTPVNSYPFVSIPLIVTYSPGSNTMAFDGGAFDLKIYTGTTPPGQTPDQAKLVQTIHLDFPAATIPAPELRVADMPAESNLSAIQTWGVGRNPAWSTDVNNPGRMQKATEVPNSGGWRAGSYIFDEDVVRSLQPPHGDYRLVAARHEVPVDTFQPHVDYFDPARSRAHNFINVWRTDWVNGNSLATDKSKYLTSGGNYDLNHWPDYPKQTPGTGLPSAVAQKYTDAPKPAGTGDFDSAMSFIQDGPYINKVDEGNTYLQNNDPNKAPYFDSGERQVGTGSGFFSPNRILPSAVMFGSLPTGIKANIPWRTLLFRPRPGHFGATNPPDYTLLDLFWMPVVDPYAISEPFSTAGLVNMNYALAPYGYIERSTAVRAVLRPEQIYAPPNSAISNYKSHNNYSQNRFPSRLPIDVRSPSSKTTGTLSQFEQRFAAGKIFRSASEICSLALVPEGETVSGMTAFRNAHALAGDNAIERSYANVYPRLTTKSNTYRVHVVAQAVQNAAGTGANFGQFNPTRDVVLGEWRGSYLVERTIDQSAATIPDFATAPFGDTLSGHHRFRILNVRQFQQ